MLDCPFCRTPFTPDNDAAELARVRARVEKKDPVAINYLGEKYCHGEVGLQKDMRRAIELWEEAKQLGSVRALFNLGFAYSRGDGVQEDEVKAVELFEQAAIKDMLGVGSILVVMSSRRVNTTGKNGAQGISRSN